MKVINSQEKLKELYLKHFDGVNTPEESAMLEKLIEWENHRLVVNSREYKLKKLEELKAELDGSREPETLVGGIQRLFVKE